MSDLSADRIFAQRLCNKDTDAISAFQRQNADELYFIASKFNNGGVTGGSWTYHRKVGKPIEVSDEISDTYLWLIKEVFKKSCKYKGNNDASFQTYIKTTLNSKLTFIDWKRWMPTSSLIQYPKKTGYIPRVIRILGDIYGKVFIMLSQYKSVGQICSKLDLDELECLVMQNKIEVELIKDGKFHLLYRPPITQTDPNSDEDGDDNIRGLWVVDDDMKIDLSLELKEFFIAIHTLIDKLAKGQKRILNLYWTEGMRIDDIYDIMIDNISYYDDITLKEKEDINRIINKSIYDLFSDFNSDFSHLASAYSIDRKSWRNIIRCTFELYNYKN